MCYCEKRAYGDYNIAKSEIREHACFIQENRLSVEFMVVSLIYEKLYYIKHDILSGVYKWILIPFLCGRMLISDDNTYRHEIGLMRMCI